MIYIVLPAFNEEANVETLLLDIARTATELMPNSDIVALVVNDGSTDGTADRVLQAKQAAESNYQRVKVSLLQHPENKGLAEAIKTGLIHACDLAKRGDIIVTMDCDNSHTPGLVPRLARRIHEGYDVIIASRYVPGARIVGLSMFRLWLSFFASKLFGFVFPIPGVRDYTCGFRAYRADLLIDVFKRYPRFISETGFTVMIDLLLKLHKHDPGLAFGEVPLLLRYDKKLGASKMNVRKTTLETLALLFRRRMGSLE